MLECETLHVVTQLQNFLEQSTPSAPSLLSSLFPSKDNMIQSQDLDLGMTA